MGSLKWFLLLPLTMVACGDTNNPSAKEKSENTTKTVHFGDLALPDFQQLVSRFVTADRNKPSVEKFIAKYQNSSITFCNDNINVMLNTSDSNGTDLLIFFESKMKNVSDCLMMCSINLNYTLSDSCPALVSLKQISKPTKSSPLNDSSKGTAADNGADTRQSLDIASFGNADGEKEPDPKQDPTNRGSNGNNELKPNPELPEEPLGKIPEGVLPPKMDDFATKPEIVEEPILTSQTVDETSHFYLYQYLAIICGVCVIFYFFVCNKKKFLALLIEGRRKNGRRRRYSAAYSRLDTNLEEALTSAPSTSASNVVAY